MRTVQPHSSKKSQLGPLFRIVREELTGVERELRNFLPQKELAKISRNGIGFQPIIDATNHIINAGGKRLRPALVLLSSRACNYRGSKSVSMAAAVELIHVATLVHDDLLHDSVLRRGKETVNAKWDPETALLVGDNLYLKTLSIIANNKDLLENNSNIKVLRLILDTAYSIFQGEVHQFAKKDDFDISEKEYFQIIEGKTASFISACCRAGAFLADSPEAAEKKFARYGLNLGIAFQIVDDLLDLVADHRQLGKSVGSDFRDGRCTLPYIHFLREAQPAERKQLLSFLKPEARKKVRTSSVTKLLEKNNSIDYSYQIAEKYASRAKKELASIPESPAKESLINLCDYVVQRKL
ncbi:MAG: polyprenyl synthetase family protein [Deltaproteobacteria bacterium]|nr:MAG: polyprenyl synthetase family protein [Deltaproteobacteria bacterium]